MPRFLYEGFLDGEQVKGSIWADDPFNAERQLMDRRIVVDRVRPAAAGGTLREAELIQFTRGMASLLRSGVPLADAGSLWLDDHKQAARWSPIFDAVREGTPLSEAMRDGRFPEYLTAMMRIGEATGTLDRSFEKSAAWLDERRQLRQTIVSALIYPAIVLVVAAAALVVLLLYVLPVFEEMYRRFDAELPTITLYLMAGTEFLERYGLVLILILAASAYGIQRAFRHPVIGLRIDAALYRIPMLGSFLFAWHQTIFCQALAHLLDAGVVLLEALNVLEPLLPNRDLRRRLALAREDILRGVPPSEALSDQRVLDRINLRLIAMAERSGELSRTLSDIGEMMGRKVDARVRTFASLFEPLLIVSLALIVGSVLVALYLPMFDIVQIME